MTNSTDKILNALLSTVTRIEKIINTKESKKEGDTSTVIEQLSVTSNQHFLNMTKHLEKIEGESKRTNELISELIETTRFNHSDSIQGLKDTSKLAGNINNLIKNIQVLGKLPDSTIDKFKSIVMISALLDPKTGKPFADDKQLDKAVETSKTLTNIVKGIALMGVSMVAFSFAVPLIAKGFLGFSVALAGLALTLWTVHKVIGKDSEKKDTGAIGTLLHIGGAILLFGGSMVLLSYTLPQVFKGFLGFTTVLAGLALTIFTVDLVLGKGKFNMEEAKSGKSGRSPLGTMASLLFGITVFSGIMIGVGYFTQPFALGALTVVLSLTALSGALNLLGTKRAEAGAKGLLITSASLVVFTGAMAGWVHLVQPHLTWEGIGMLGATVGTMALIGTILGVSPMDKWSKSGAIALTILGGALSAFSVGLSIYTHGTKDLTWEKLGMLGTAIGTMSLIATVLGVPPVVVFAGLGACALILLSGALITFSAGLSIFARSGFTKENATDLNSALRYTMAGFLGYENLDDVGAKALVRVPMMVALLAPASVAMGMAGLALLPLSEGLSIFKRISWTEDDSKMLKSAIFSTINSFTEGFKDVNLIKLGFGIRTLRNVGSVLTGLAEGIQSFANLSFVEYEYDEKKGRLIESKRIRLTDNDITNTGIAIGNVISALTKPIAEFGEQISTGSGGHSFLGVNWGSMKNISFGIQSLQGIGNGLVNLASGVRDWANMTITEYDVRINPKTKMPEIVPIKKRPITKGEIDGAMTNIGIVLSGLAKPLADFGTVFTSDSSMFYGAFKVENKGLKLGIETMAQIGTGLVNIADSVVRWANMEYTEMGVVRNPRTGMNEIVPKKISKISQPMVMGAITNIGFVLSALTKPLADFGETFTRGNNKRITRGIESLGGLSKTITDISDMVVRWANMEYTEMSIYTDPRTGETKLQPKNIVNIGKEKIDSAKVNIETVLSVLSDSIVNYSNKIDGANLTTKRVNRIVENISNIQKELSGVARDMSEKWNTGDLVASSDNFRKWMLNITYATPQALAITSFSNNITKLANVASDFEKFARAFDKMAIAMGTFSKNFNLMNPDGIRAFNTWSSTLLTAVEVGKQPEFFNKFLDSADKSVNSAFEFGSKLFGSDEKDSELGENERRSIIEKTNEMTRDDQMTKLIEVVSELQAEIVGLKSALGSTLNVNIQSASPGVRIKTRPDM